MSLKNSNEITVKVNCELNELYTKLEEKGFKAVYEFTMDDTYFVPKNINLQQLSTREILAKAVLVREIIGNSITKLITVKNKKFDNAGNILSQAEVNCDILEIADGKNLLKVLEYEEIMNIKEKDVVYEKDKFQIAIKDILNGDNLIEVELEEDEELNTIEKLIRKINEIEIPIDTNNYFVKKAEIELDKVLNRKLEV